MHLPKVPSAVWQGVSRHTEKTAGA